MSIRLKASTIRGAQAEVRASWPWGGTIKGFYQDEKLDVEDRQVYESVLFKRPKSLFRRKTKLNEKRTKPDYFIFDPSNGPPVEGENGE